MPTASIKDLGPLQPQVDSIIESAKKQIKVAQDLHGGNWDALEEYINIVREVSEQILDLQKTASGLTNEQKQLIAAEAVVDIVDYLAGHYAPWWLRWVLRLSPSTKLWAAKLLVDIVYYASKGAKKGVAPA